VKAMPQPASRSPRLAPWLASFAMLTVCLAAPLCADVCNPTDLQGLYGFQLSGDTAISGESKPVTSVGSLLLASDGGISGTSTVMFAGLLLGNPVTGTFEAHWDCTVVWSLQDDSGAFQHFSGIATHGGRNVDFRQTDPRGSVHGNMARTAADCKASALRNEYAFSMAGSSTPMLPGETTTVIAYKGSIKAGENGIFKFGATDVTMNVDAGCTVVIQLALPQPINLRGMLVDEGKRILAIGTDPGQMVSATFTAP